MELIYYRNFDVNSFYNEVDFKLSSEYSIRSIVNYVNDSFGDSYSHVEVSFEIVQSKIGSLFSEEDAISDVSVVVGENGVGKSTLINEILFFGGASRFNHSWQLLLSKHFLLLGEKIKISVEEINKLKDIFPDMKFINTNKNFYSENLDFFVELEKNQSLFQFLSGKKNVLFNYSNSIEPTKIPNYSGKIYSTSEQMEEGISVIDISTSNYLVQSNKWGLESILKETIFENNLLSMDNYQVSEFLQLYFKYPWFKKLIPDTISSKIELRFHLGALPELFNRFIIENNLFLNFDASYPRYHALINTFKADYVTQVYREFLLATILKLVDYYADPVEGISTSIDRILSDFENSIKEIYPATKNEFQIEEFIKLIEVYQTESKELERIEFSSIWTSFRKMMIFMLQNKKFSSQAVTNGFDEFSGLRFKLIDSEPEIKEFLNLYGNLTSHSKFRLPFFKFSLTNLSSGERNFLFLISRLMNHISMLEEVGDAPDTITILLDEPGNDYHPEWQRTFFFNLRNAINQYSNNQRKINVQLLITTHSPFILSDFTNQNIIKLERKQAGDNHFKTVRSSNFQTNTFGANIYDLIADSFFMKNGFIGEFAKEKIEELLRELYDLKSFYSESNEGFLSHEKFIEYRDRINLIGERIIKIRLFDLLNDLPRQKSPDEIKAEELEKEAREIRRKLNLNGED
ncbi:MAG: AAA family ATPase [Flavobacteriales bacterium]|nr:AAA family ATPase [Flavobacteriales bacterium]